MTLTLRAMKSADLARVAVLSAELGYPGTDEAFRRRFAAIENPGDHLFVIEESGRILGWTQLEEHRLVFEEPYAEIMGLVVAMEGRKRGIGKKLVEHAVSWARARHLATLMVHSNVVRPEAHEFYPRTGFSRTKTQHVYSMTIE